MRSFTLGKYIPYDTWIHRMDPRVKLLGTILLMVCVFLGYGSWAMSFAMQAAILLISVVLMVFSHISIRSLLHSLRALWLTIILLLLIYCLTPYPQPVFGIAWQVKSWGWTVYWDSFAQAAKILLRLIMMIALTMVLTATTKPLDLTYALEWYMTPLKVVRFPAHEIAMTVSIALRFIPTLLDDAMRIMKSQQSRGVDFAHGRFLSKVTGITSLIIPLFVSAFVRSDQLADAMECRGYDPKEKRTRYRVLRPHWFDWVALVLLCGIVGVYIWWANDPNWVAILKFPAEMVGLLSL